MHCSGNLEARKVVYDVHTVCSPPNMDHMVQKQAIFSFVSVQVQTADT